MSSRPFLQKLTLHNFRSIQNETIHFSNPLFLVGRNDTGKTNILEAVSFLAECTKRSLQTAVEFRGGFGSLSYLHGIGKPYEAPIHLRADFWLEKTQQQGHYAFALGFVPGSPYDFQVLHEQCYLTGSSGETTWFDRTRDRFITSVEGLTLDMDSQALALPLAGGVQAFAAFRRALASMQVYAIEPGRLRRQETSFDTSYLKRDGSNLVSILQKLNASDPDVLTRVTELLTAIVPGLTGIHLVVRDKAPVLMFTQKAERNADLMFDISRMADGTLRALGLITAAIQSPAPSLMAFDEPELYMHLGAISSVSDALHTAAQRSQIIVATHSPELIDAKWIEPDNLCIVEKINGATHIAGLGASARNAIRQHLMGAGELLRANALDAVPNHSPSTEINLFEPVPA